MAIPQADEQQRLLANLLGLMTADKKPMPRFWYFPRGVKAAVIMTGDDHAQGGTAGRFDQFLAASPAGCSVAQWECIRGSSYVYPELAADQRPGRELRRPRASRSACTSTRAARTTPAHRSRTTSPTSSSSGRASTRACPLPTTQRTHCIVWSDWASTPRVELANGMRLDGNYYYWPPGWVLDVPGMFTGSGMPMRFADTDGSLIDVYQSTTQMTDESGQTFPFTINTLLDRALGATGYYGAFNANMHTDAVNSPGADAIVASAKARGVPVVSAEQMMTWLDGRNGSSFGAISYAGDVLSFRVSVGAGATALRGMVPATFAGKALTGMARNGTPITFTRETIKGVEYAFFPATSGDYTASYAPDTVPPAISAVSAVAAADGTATVTWTTDEAADSRVDYGTAPTTLTLNASDAAAVTAHSVRLTGLTPGTTYHYRVRSADGSGNATTAPSTPGDVRGPGDRVPGDDDDRDRHGAGGHRRLADRGRQRLLPGQLDHGRHPHDLVVGLVHGRPGRPEQPAGDVRGPQLALVHPGPRRLALDRQHVAAARLAGGRQRRRHPRRPRAAGCRGHVRERDRRGARPRALHGYDQRLLVGRPDEDHVRPAVRRPAAIMVGRREDLRRHPAGP